MKQEKKIISYESYEKGTDLKQDQFLLLQAAVQKMLMRPILTFMLAPLFLWKMEK